MPSRFKSKLTQNSFVYKLLDKISNLLSLPNSPYYFPEYTLHDERHISTVLEYADKLIPEDVFERMSQKAIEVLIGATALHDLGMYITQDGLSSLVIGKYKDELMKHLDRKTWNEEWEEFIHKARRFSDSDLFRLFGNIDPIENLSERSIPTQILLCGEFIRKNHARLAQHIAVHGFPGNTDIDVFEDCGIPNQLKEIIGLIARSHGMRSLREAEIFIKRMAMPIPIDVPKFYLSAILQIADTLDVGSKRAPKEMEERNRFSSPESSRHFRLNQAFNEPEFDLPTGWVNLHALPKCSETFVGAESLLAKIQKELDTNMAILTEKYSDRYKFTIQRVGSNLLDEDKVEAIATGYLARGASLGVNPGITKLLVGPLYNENPFFGVRELVSNAIDACRLRKMKEGTEGHIIVKIDLQNKTFTISDNGIGMNEDVLCNYYLVSGSSYRSSDAWRENSLGNDGKTNIMRSGRFGIGALGGFLLGDKIDITTRYVEDESAYVFSYTKEPHLLNIERMKKDKHGNSIEIGTTITISLNDDSWRRFKNTKDKSRWIWYHFSEPKVTYFLNGATMKPSVFVVPEKGLEKDGWFDIESVLFPNLKLNFTMNKQNIVCIINGIRIDRISNSNKRNSINDLNGYSMAIKERGLDVPSPIVSINDYNNDDELGINLNRTAIARFPEEDVVIRETYKYYLAQLLSLPHEGYLKIASLSQESSSCYFRQVFAVNDYGFTLCRPTFLRHAQQPSVMFVYHRLSKVNADMMRGKATAFLPFEYPDSISLGDEEIIKRGFLTKRCKKYWYMPKDERAFEEKIVANARYDLHVFRNAANNRNEHGVKAYQVSHKGVKRSKPPMRIGHEVPLILEYIPKKPCEDEQNIMIKVLTEYLPFEANGGWIPFKMEERREKYEKAFRELGKYMKMSCVELP